MLPNKPSKSPRRILTLCLAIPLSITAAHDITAAVRNTKNSLSSTSVAPKATASKVEFLKNGTQRILRVKGKNLETLHTSAHQEFLKRIEKEIKNPQNQFTIGSFETDVYFKDGEFVFEYKIKLTPAKKANEVHRLVAMRGSVWCGKNAKEKVIAENMKKIPIWQRNIIKAFPQMKIWYEVARSENDSPQGLIYHEAVLAKAALN